MTTDWQALVELLPEAVVVVTHDGVITYLNPAATALTGYALAEARGTSVTLLVPPEERRRVNVVVWLARWGEQPEPLQWRYLHLTGRTRDHRDLRLAVRVARLPVAGAVNYVITMRDVGEELRNIADLRHQHLVTSRVLALSQDGVVILDQALTITYANPAMAGLFGYPVIELVGKPLTNLLPPRFRARYAAHVRAFESGAAPSRMRVRRSLARCSVRARAAPAWRSGTWPGGRRLLTGHLRTHASSYALRSPARAAAKSCAPMSR